MSRKLKAGIVVACVFTALLSAVAIATGGGDTPEPSAGENPDRAPGHEIDLDATPKDWHPVYNDEALACTGKSNPVNFETFSSGPSVAGLPLTYTERRCDGGPVIARANYVSYIYGDCEIVEGATGCQPPLEVQTWPACQRYLAKYSFRGKPLPHRFLAKRGGGEVVEISLGVEPRLEVYTESSTIVIFAIDRNLAMKAVELLRPQEKGKPPATDPNDLKGPSSKSLGAPTEGALKGALPCHQS